MGVTQVAPFLTPLVLLWDLKNQQAGLLKIPTFQLGSAKTNCRRLCVVTVSTAEQGY